MENKQIFTVPELDTATIRVDKFLTAVFHEATRSQLKQRITGLLINGKAAKLSHKVISSDVVEVHYTSQPAVTLEAEQLPLDLLYEDSNVIVLNKPQGLVVHPGAGHFSGTLVNGLLGYYHELQANFENRELRPGIVHRLDKDTSGVIITAKNAQAHEALSAQFRHGRTEKHYLAVVKGSPPQQEGVIDAALKRDPHSRQKFTIATGKGKAAITHYRLLHGNPAYSLLLLRPRTGRTHQLRVHLQYLGCPVLGDPIYSRKDANFPDTGLLLHAWQLKIRLPGETVLHHFSAPLPGYFVEFINKMEWGEVAFKSLR